MFCPMCGAPNEDDDEFCGNCGATLGPDLPAEGATARAVGETAGTEAVAEVAPAAAGGIEIKAGEEKWPGPSQEAAVPALVPAGKPQLPPPSRPAYRPEPVKAAPAAATSGLAIASLLLGIGGLTIVPLVGSVLAIIFGYMARRDIRSRRPGELTGDGMALAGIVMGWIAVGLAVLGLLLGIGIGVCGLCGALGSGNF